MKEGAVELPDELMQANDVFFNPIQKLQRSWSVAVLTQFAHERCEVLP
eukprot:CAMPEP_0205910910 /NCGR_PEP_ID=MMETSP1325-20131115/4786_1 /ASSEMBLY_ACC=CAM_ASM_000708 /TAXON_ID=236786 /ORGANISM="Florenciella sp., Strain RCC1007" /LENGTH=47 /DNA_ID= /DNA_START= /DNA_END= /DNA_ORIENTATION=